MNDKISCTFIGHATTLIQWDDTAIMTDPHLGKRVLISPRRHPLPIDPGKLPDLSAVLISHTHCDHLDISSYKYISCGVPIFVPEGRERAIGKYMPNPVIELSHFARHELPDGTEITAVPVVHSQCHFIPTWGSKANGYLIRRPGAEGSVYFCGDSAYGPHFAETGNLGKIDLAILPIGSYGPRWFMRRIHMTPAEAITAFEEMRAAHMIPIHYGTFRLSFENPEAPLKWLRTILEERQDLAGRVHPVEPGRTFVLDAASSLTMVSNELVA